MRDLIVSHILVLAQDPGSAPIAPPGAAQWNKFLGWAKWFALAVAFLTVLVSGIVWQMARMSNNPKVQGGAGKAIFGGLGLAALVGAVEFIVATGKGIGDSFGG